LNDSRSICCSSLGVRSKRSPRGAADGRAALPRFWTDLKVRPARPAARTLFFDAPKSNRSAGSRTPSRSSRLRPAKPFSARRPYLIPRSAIAIGRQGY
jgi:hypothetical protein